MTAVCFEFIRWLRKETPLSKWTGVVYHGSEPEGLLELLHAPEIQAHHMGMLLSVSTNDNIIQYFGEYEDHRHTPFPKLFHCGATWELKDILIRDFREKPEIYQILIEMFALSIESMAPSTRETLEILGIMHQGDIHPEILRHEDSIMRLAFHGCHGLALPGFDDYNGSHNNEAELALTSRGCARLARITPDYIYFEEDWMEPDEGLAALRNLVDGPALELCA